jgi:hypothetical protein
MGALPRPDLPPGPHRDLVEGLHHLHHQAGWPSLRALARETGVSHTTVSKVMSSPALPSWGTVELLVEAMDGDIAHFHQLWLEASAPSGPGSSPTPLVAGRGAELAAVRRHLEVGSGLLLVAGDAGMGKTTLLQAATGPPGPAIVVGHCFPLSANTPFMPLADALRSLHETDGGQRLASALAGCAPYVAGELARLLPELSPSTPVRPAGEWARPQLFGALGSLLRALTDRARIALVIEDVHWADANTLDFLEHLTGHGSPVPMAASWRLADATTASWSTEWFNRVRRLPCVGEIVLSPLTEDATADQLRRLAPEMDPATVYARSRGHPLFTAQLAAHGDDGDLPRLLADLLDSRLGALEGSAWLVARALGVADRPMRFDVLTEAVGGDADTVRSGLRALADRWLLASHGAQSAALAHPLLAEAVRRRLLPGEGPEQHRVLAQVLGRRSDTAPAEVAEHWQLAGDEVQELGWRVAAAHAAAERYDRSQEAEQWLRVLDIWPSGGDAREVGHVSRETAYLAAIDALQGSMQFDRAAELSDAAEDVLRPTDVAVRAELLRYAAIFRGQREGSEVGRRLLDEALALYVELPVSEGRVRALDWKQNLLRGVGEFAAAHDVARTAVDAALELGDPVLTRRTMGRLAWHVGVHGDLTGARRLLDQAEGELPAGTDPLGDVRRSVIETDLLVIRGAHIDDVVAAGSRGLATAAEVGVDNYDVMLVRFNTAWALVLAGRVAQAAELAPTMDPPANVLDRWAVHLLSNVVDGLRGDTDAAGQRIQQLRQAMPGSWENDLELLVVAERIESWLPAAMRQPDLIVTALDVLVGRAPPWLVAPGLVAAARAAADLGGSAGGAEATHAQHLDFFLRSGLPRPGQQAEPYLGVHSAAWAAEMARLTGGASVDQWVRVAQGWDDLSRPHDAAYCRWRAAQRALRDGQGTLAANLLARAARDAREHVPLSHALAATRGRTT